MAFIISITWLALVIYLLARAVRQQHALPKLLPNRERVPADAPDVAVIVPARDEAANIAPCLATLLNQDYPAAHLHLTVVDDNSSDKTAEIAALLDDRITVLRAPPLSAGWTGKPHACAVGAAVAPAAAEWLCFIDADMRAAPHLMASALAAARSGKLDLLSLAPRHELRSVPERLLIPCGHYLLAVSQNLARVQAPDSNDVVAMGQFMLLRRRAYVAVGGHAAVRNAICEDIELARLLKRRGYRVLLMDGVRLLSGRMYTGWRTLWPGLAKNLIDMLGGSLATVIKSIAAVALAWATLLVPLIDLVGWVQDSPDAGLALVPALAASAMVFSLHLAGAIHFRIPLWYGVLFPFGYSVGALLAFDSLLWRLKGRVRWKDRAYEA